RVPVLIVSQIGTAISFVMLGLAQNVEMLFAARILDGITGGNIIVAQAYITDITPREKRTQSLGLIFAVFGLGFIIGPALGGILSALLGPRIPFLIAAVAATAIIIMTWLTLDETLSPEQREANRNFKKAGLRPGDVARNLPLLLILFVAFTGQFILGLLQSTFALYGGAVLFADSSEEMTNL
ncbi:MAG: TCR/Tet family MFS transporter, partial [Chloroflexi bacterium]|nr:TCR/Tet family MFS transporter [Chloroflexota bacterium]